MNHWCHKLLKNFILFLLELSRKGNLLQRWHINQNLSSKMSVKIFILTIFMVKFIFYITAKVKQSNYSVIKKVSTLLINYYFKWESIDYCCELKQYWPATEMMILSREQWFTLLILMSLQRAAWVEFAFKSRRNKNGFVFDMDLWGYDCFIVIVAAFKFFLKSLLILVLFFRKLCCKN